MAGFPAPGERFAGYLVRKVLGRGGMGVVFEAVEERLGRTVALKVLPPELADVHDYRTRFAREASTLARVDSPHIITVFAHGEHEGCLYIATQYVAGGDLGAALQAHGPAPLATTAQILAQVASALAAAHQAGVVHRDVKPSNVLLRNLTGDPYAYLCDFGIAQNTVDRTTGGGLTATGAVAGTFAYVSPERLDGQPATPAADVYGLGCVLWTALTGAPPYAGTDVQMAIAHLNAPVPLFVPDDPAARAVNAILQRTMAKDPAARPDAAAVRTQLAMVADLAAHRATVLTPATAVPPPTPSTQISASSGSSGSNPTLAPPPGVPPPSWRPSTPTPPPRRRRPALIAVGVVAVVALVGGGATALALAGQDEDPRAGDPPATETTGTTSEPTEAAPSATGVASPTTHIVTPSDPPTSTEPEDEPFYPDVRPSRGTMLTLGAARLKLPVGWTTIEAGKYGKNTVGGRDFDGDHEGFVSSIFIRRSKAKFPLDSVVLLNGIALADADSLAENNENLELIKSNLNSSAWLDGKEAARIRVVFHDTDADLYAAEETWYAYRKGFIYRVTFQFSRIDKPAERRAVIDPVVVSFRWKK